MALEIKPGRYLFAMTTRGIMLALNVLHTMFGQPIGSYDVYAPKIEAFRGTVRLSPKDYPELVTFDDLDVPSSARKVDSENLSATFGPGVSLKAIIITITDEPRTKGSIVEYCLG